MPLEDLTGPDKYLDALNTAWPLDDDERPEGDDHIRGIKNVLVNTFGPLAQLYDLAKAVFYNEPQPGQPYNSGAISTAVGTEAQRPPAPINGDMRTVTDNDASSRSSPEIYISPSWYQIPLLDANQLWKGVQTMQVPDAGQPDNQIAKLNWGKVRDDIYARIFGRVLTDDQEGQIELSIKSGGATLGVATLDAVSGLLLDAAVPGVFRGGNRLLEQNHVAYESAATVFTLGQIVSFTHGLGFRPKLYKAYLENAVTEHDYVPGDEIEFGTTSGTSDTQNNQQNAISALVVDSDTALKLVISSRQIAVPTKSSGEFKTITPASWLVKVRAWG